MTPPGAEAQVELAVLGQPFLGLNGGPNCTPDEAVCVQVLTEGQDATDRC